jgi:DNA-binding MarR family transcriptional regulator
MREILREIGMIARCFESIANIEFKELDLTKNQYIYLIRICENPGVILERITDMLKVDRSTASRAVEKLNQAGFVRKETGDENRKNVRLYPTEKGAEVFSMLKKVEAYSDSVALDGITPEEKDILLSLLTKVRRNIEPDWDLVKRGGKRGTFHENQSES